MKNRKPSSYGGGGNDGEKSRREGVNECEWKRHENSLPVR